MKYALIEKGVVTNIIWLYSANAASFPNAVPMDGYPVAINDTYDGEFFYHDGKRILSIEEEMEIIRASFEILIGE